MPVWRALTKTTPKVSRGSVDNARTNERVHHLRLNYKSGVRTMTFHGEIRSAVNPTSYGLTIMFKKVDRDSGLTDEEIVEGFYPKPVLGEHEVLLRCSCPSYRFRFDQANRTHGVGTGAKFRPYRRKTNRRPNNPRGLAGFCKHGLEFVEYLQRNGFII